jgi:hypothetical protein
MKPRIHVRARDYDTRRHMPTPLYEDIKPMVQDEFSGRHKLATWAVCLLITGIFWYAAAKAVGL